MSRKYNIFIAASKELEEERTCIKELVSELNTFYDIRGIHLLACAYDDFQDNQPAYNEYITRTADLVIFVLKGEIGKYTEREYLLSQDSYNKNGHPAIIVFMQKFTTPTPETGKIEGLLKASGEKYYIGYQNKEDLKKEVKKKIQYFVEEEELSRRKKLLLRIKKSIRFYTPLILTLALFVLGGLLVYEKLNKQPTLVFAGGGSVANFIKGNTLSDSIDITSYPNSIYINLASGSAWALLAEEANRYMEENETGKHQFVSICLSADRIDSTFVNEKTRQMFNKTCVVEYFLGYDPLCVYVKNDCIEKLGLNKDSIIKDSIISASLLAKVIKKSVDSTKIRLFTTSKGSGTLRLYQRCFNKADSINLEEMLDSNKSYLFYQNSSSDYINRLDQSDYKPCVILGSVYYYPPQILEEGYSHFHVSKEGEGVVKKPIYLYFVANKKEDQQYGYIQKPVIDFLKNIHADKYIESSTWRILEEKRQIKLTGEKILKLKSKKVNNR